MSLARRGPQPLIYLPSNFLPCGPALCTISFRSVPFIRPWPGYPFARLRANLTEVTPW